MVPIKSRAAQAAALALALAGPAGAVEVKPYGFILATSVQYWGRPNSIEVPTQANSAGSLAASNQNTSAFTARQSRLGLNLAGGKGPFDSDLSGVVEIDFAGLRNSGTSSADILAPAPRLDMTVRAIIERWPAAAPVLARWGLDLCCGGAHPLGLAAKAHGRDAEKVLAEIAQAAAGGRNP